MPNRAIVAVLDRWRAILLVGFGCCVGMIGLLQMFGLASVQSLLAGVFPGHRALLQAQFSF